MLLFFLQIATFSVGDFVVRCLLIFVWTDTIIPGACLSCIVEDVILFRVEAGLRPSVSRVLTMMSLPKSVNSRGILVTGIHLPNDKRLKTNFQTVHPILLCITLCIALNWCTAFKAIR